MFWDWRWVLYLKIQIDNIMTMHTLYMFHFKPRTQWNPQILVNPQILQTQVAPTNTKGLEFYNCFLNFYGIGLCPLKCMFGIVGFLWCFQMARYIGQLGLACSWIPRRKIEPQILVAPSVSSEVCPHCIHHWLTLPGGNGED